MTEAGAHTELAQETRNVAIPILLHRRLKSMAAADGRTLQSMVVESIEAGLHTQQFGKNPNSLPVDAEAQST